MTTDAKIEVPHLVATEDLVRPLWIGLKTSCGFCCSSFDFADGQLHPNGEVSQYCPKCANFLGRKRVSRPTELSLPEIVGPSHVLSVAGGSEAALIRGIWVMIEDIEKPHPEVAQYIPRINVASKLRTLLMAAGYEWQTPPNS